MRQSRTVYDAAGRAVAVYSTANIMHLEDEKDAGGAVLRSWQVYDDDGPATTTGYDALDRVTSTYDAFGNRTFNQYDVRGNLIATLHPGGTETRSVFNDMGRAIWTTDRYIADSTITGDTPDFHNTLLAISGTHTIYDALGRVARTERYSSVAIHVVDDTSVSGVTGLLKTVFVSAPTLISSTENHYDESGRLYQTVEIAGANAATGFTKTTTTTFYPDGSTQAVTVVGSLPGGTGTIQTTTNYATHRVVDLLIGGAVEADDQFTLTIPDPTNSANTTYTLTVVAPTADRSLLCQAIVSALSAAAMTDPLLLALGLTAERCASLTGDFVRLHSTTAEFTFQVTAATTDAGGAIADGQTFVARALRQSAVIDNAGHATTTDFDALGREVRVTCADGSFTETVYGAYGATVQKVAQRKAGESPVVTTYQYDPAGRLISVMLPDPDGLTGPQEPSTWRYVYDACGNQTQIIDPRSSQTNPAWNSTGAAIVTKFSYDAFGRQIGRAMPDGKSETFAYDAYGRQVLHTDFKGQIAESVYSDSLLPDDENYSSLGRLVYTCWYTSAADRTNGTLGDQVQYSYDAYGRVFMATQGAEDIRETAYTYDPLTGSIATVGSPEGTLSYTYDPASGRLVRTQVLHDSTITEETIYRYDALGRLWYVYATVLQGTSHGTLTGGLETVPTFSGYPLTTSYSYDAAGNLKSTLLPNNAQTTYTYDSLNRLTLEEVSCGWRMIQRYDYTLLTDGQRDGVEETRWDNTGANPVVTVIDWTYDCVGRLIEEAWDGGALNVFDGTDYTDVYAYDPVGNRLGKVHDEVDLNQKDGVIAYQYNLRDELLQEVSSLSGTTTYGYDFNGSMITKSQGGQSTTYTWNLQNRLVLFHESDNSQDVALSYAVDGRRISRTENGTTTLYFLDNQNPTGYSQVVEELTPGGVLKVSYLLGQDVLGQAKAADVRQGPEDALTYLLYDGHGSTRGLLSPDGLVVARYDFDAYGLLRPPVMVDLAETPLQYSGEWTDARLQMQDLRERWFSMVLGRFASQDPYDGQNANPQGFHKYLYCHSNPITLIDPSGLFYIPPSLRSVFRKFAKVDLGLRILIGIRATYVFGEAYMAEVNAEDVHINRQIARLDDASMLDRIEEFVDAATGTLLPLYRNRPDILDLKNQRVYEIKAAASAWTGSSQVAGYISTLATVYPLKLFLPGTWKPERDYYSIGSLFGLPLFFDLHGENIGGGVIAYTIHPSVEVTAVLIQASLKVLQGMAADKARVVVEPAHATLLSMISVAAGVIL